MNIKRIEQIALRLAKRGPFSTQGLTMAAARLQRMVNQSGLELAEGGLEAHMADLLARAARNNTLLHEEVTTQFGEIWEAHKEQLEAIRATEKHQGGPINGQSTKDAPQNERAYKAPQKPLDVPVLAVMVVTGQQTETDPGVLGLRVGEACTYKGELVAKIEGMPTGWLARDKEGYPLGFLSAGNHAYQIEYTKDAKVAEILKSQWAEENV